jgi:predicted TIM-barrel fold metal-dependent hydrolase
MLLQSQQMFGAPHPPEDYLEKIEGLGIVHAAALVMAPRGDLPLTRELNDRVIELASRHDGLFFPVCSVHPFDGEDALSELRRVAEHGARWLKLHPITQDFDVADPLVAAVVTEASRLDLPVLFDAYCPWDPAQPGKFIQLAREIPDSKLILAHAHGPNFIDLLAHQILSHFSWWPRRVWFDISATTALLADGPLAEQFVWVLRKVGIDRVLFGSDYPYDSPRVALDAVRSLGFSSDELQAVLYDNAADLLGLPAP